MLVTRSGTLHAAINVGRVVVVGLIVVILGRSYLGLFAHGQWPIILIMIGLFAVIPATTASPSERIAAWRWWLVYVVGVILFAAVRSVCDSAGASVHYRDGFVIEQFIFHGQTASAILQHAFMRPNAFDPLSIVMTLVYGSFFAVPRAVGIYLGRRRPTELASYVYQSLFIWIVGLICFVIIPTAPPWMAARDGYVQGIDRVDILLLHPNIYQQLTRYIGVNDVAAMPSIHVAITWLAILAFWSRGRWWRVIGSFYGATMIFAVVYLGEHWIVDAIAGLVLVLVARYVVNHVHVTWPITRAHRRKFVWSSVLSSRRARARQATTDSRFS